MKRYDALLHYCKLPYEEFNGNHPGPTKDNYIGMWDDFKKLNDDENATDVYEDNKEFYIYLNKGNKWKEELFTDDNPFDKSLDKYFTKDFQLGQQQFEHLSQKWHLIVSYLLFGAWKHIDNEDKLDKWWNDSLPVGKFGCNELKEWINRSDRRIALSEKAHEAMKNSYCKYSGFSVGAALLCDGGDVYTGCNVENASYGAGNCAERTAIFKAVSEGHRKFTAIAICGGKDINNTVECPPCGICRQVMSEFCDNSFEIILPVFEKGSIVGLSKHTLGDLLPLAFDM